MLGVKKLYKILLGENLICDMLQNGKANLISIVRTNRSALYPELNHASECLHKK